MGGDAGDEFHACHHSWAVGAIEGSLQPDDFGGDHGAAVGEGLAFFVQAYVNVDHFAFVYGHGGGEFDAEASGGDVGGLAAVIAGGHGFIDLDGSILRDSQAPAAFSAQCAKAGGGFRFAMVHQQHRGFLAWDILTSIFVIGTVGWEVRGNLVFFGGRSYRAKLVTTRGSEKTEIRNQKPDSMPKSQFPIRISSFKR